MIDRTEPLIPLREISRHLPFSMRRPHTSTCIRWALRGVGHPTTKLETVKVGGRRYTTLAAIERFVRVLTMRDPEVSEAQRTPGIAFQRAEAELDADGVA